MIGEDPWVDLVRDIKKTEIGYWKKLQEYKQLEDSYDRNK